MVGQTDINTFIMLELNKQNIKFKDILFLQCFVIMLFLVALGVIIQKKSYEYDNCIIQNMAVLI